MTTNQYVLIVFAPLLVATGILGFLVPKDKALLSGEPLYNIFHILFGAIGLSTVLLLGDSPARVFNFAFGAIDLYQAIASFCGWFPANSFKWKRADDVLHVVIGAFLVLVGLFG